MAEVSHRRSLEEIRRTVEQSLHSFDEGEAGIDKRPPASEYHPSSMVDPENSEFRPGDPKQETRQLTGGAVAERIERIGEVSALAIMEACETTATDIEQTGQAAVDFAAEIMDEAKELAAGLRAKGTKMTEHLKEFAQLAKKVSITMRDTRKEVINTPEADGA
ncbi:MAG TPA: hypothetical protein VF913_06005 [Xanthobacteraceae bacterium]